MTPPRVWVHSVDFITLDKWWLYFISLKCTDIFPRIWCQNFAHQQKVKRLSNKNSLDTHCACPTLRHCCFIRNNLKKWYTTTLFGNLMFLTESIPSESEITLFWWIWACICTTNAVQTFISYFHCSFQICQLGQRQQMVYRKKNNLWWLANHNDVDSHRTNIIQWPSCLPENMVGKLPWNFYFWIIYIYGRLNLLQLQIAYPSHVILVL